MAEAGKISTAARELEVSQPGLSQLIQRLERRLGSSLFTRTPGGVVLTPVGESFRRHGQQVLEELAAVLADANGERTQVRIGVPPGVPDALLATVQLLADQRWQAAPAFVTVHTEQQLAKLRDGQLDLAVVREPVDASGLVMCRLSDEEIGVVVSASHPLADRPEATWSDLAHGRLLWFDERHAPSFAGYLLDVLAAHGARPGLHVAESDRHALFVHLLTSSPDLMALRPRGSVRPDDALVWRPLADGAPRERFALVAPTGTALALHEDADARIAVREGSSAPGPRAAVRPRLQRGR